MKKLRAIVGYFLFSVAALVLAAGVVNIIILWAIAKGVLSAIILVCIAGALSFLVIWYINTEGKYK